jgi:hypothetical protein
VWLVSLPYPTVREVRPEPNLISVQDNRTKNRKDIGSLKGERS